jgi:hypothetical protein
MKAAIQEGERIERGTFSSPEACNKAVAVWVAKYDRRINSYPFNIRHFSTGSSATRGPESYDESAVMLFFVAVSGQDHGQ